jgi:hypothetical protein
MTVKRAWEFLKGHEKLLGFAVILLYEKQVLCPEKWILPLVF